MDLILVDLTPEDAGPGRCIRALNVRTFQRELKVVGGQRLRTGRSCGSTRSLELIGTLSLFADGCSLDGGRIFVVDGAFAASVATGVVALAIVAFFID